LKRLEAAETTREIALTYNVAHTTIARLKPAETRALFVAPATMGGRLFFRRGHALGAQSIGGKAQVPRWSERLKIKPDNESSRVYLYTTHAVGFYEKLGWKVIDRTNWKGFDTALMVRDL
jgi:hypothetical protein